MDCSANAGSPQRPAFICLNLKSILGDRLRRARVCILYLQLRATPILARLYEGSDVVVRARIGSESTWYSHCDHIPADLSSILHSIQLLHSLQHFAQFEPFNVDVSEVDLERDVGAWLRDSVAHGLQFLG